jgi:hypothetical protein
MLFDNARNCEDCVINGRRAYAVLFKYESPGNPVALRFGESFVRELTELLIALFDALPKEEVATMLSNDNTKINDDTDPMITIDFIASEVVAA